MPAALLYFLFFCSGFSGLVYQVVWVREFGNVLGTTLQTTSLVVAVFMLGLGSGSVIVGRWSDRRYEHAPESLLRAYGIVELVIAGLGVAIMVVLPRLHALASVSSSYVRDSSGWFELSTISYVARGAIALGVLGPSAFLMGGTLTLLIRHRVRGDVERASGWKIAVLYAVNTAGAATGAFLTDFALVPSFGLTNTQLVAVLLNLIAGAGALVLARASAPARKTAPAAVSLHQESDMPQALYPVAWTSLALVLCGFAAMGLEIVWLRHFTLLLGGFRAVFSLVLTIVLVGIGAGSLLGGYIDRRTSRPAQALMMMQALLVASALMGLGWTSVEALDAHRRAIDATLPGLTPFARWITELWYSARPMLIELGVPALLMGCSFPLGNAVIQRTERAVGSRAGALYLANTAGAVCGSLVTGFVLLPMFGMQGSATALTLAAALAIAPLYLGTRAARGVAITSAVAASVPVVIAAVAVLLWLRLPADYVLGRSLARLSEGERLLTLREGVTEVIGVTEVPGRGRGLITNGHPMSSTALLDQRYMRALAHIPLLSMSAPTHVLVIGFGVGNSTHAATLHPSVERIDVADLSRDILGHAGYFRDANKDVLNDPRVRVYVNDGRQHLAMQPASAYDLITLEPPPIAHAGVAALYSREFYSLARSRLKPDGYLSQWLPAYQVSPETSLAMIRAFIEVFPQSVLLSGTQAELLLVGTNGASIEIDPGRVARALDQAPGAAADLRRLDLGSVTEIVGTFVGSADTLARATRQSPAVSDDRPLQEYGVRSAIGSGTSGVPASIFELAAAASWCPRCFEGERPTPLVAGLDTYLALLDDAYHAAGTDGTARGPYGERRILGSAYLGAVVPDSDAVHNVIGVTLLRQGRYDDAAAAFHEALKRRADSVDANRNLGTALAASGHVAESMGYLRRAVQLAPGNGGAQYELGTLLLDQRRFAEAADCFQAAVNVMPNSAAAHNDLGIALASMGNLSQATEHFRRAVALDPAFEEARRNLASALKARPR
jgi:predicted membrane-bound spermidine synthase